jgi:hypothetical protein
MRQVAVAILQRLNATRLQLLDVFGGEQKTGADEDSGSPKTQLFGESRASEQAAGTAVENDSRGTA